MIFSRMHFALAASALTVCAVGPVSSAMGPTHFAEAAVTPQRRKRVQRIGGGVCRKYRNRWKQERPKKRNNMQHVSRRAKRRHRRARKAA